MPSANITSTEPAALTENLELVSDLARFREGLLTEQQVRRKYRFDTATWDAAGDDNSLVRAVEEESIRRVRDGSAKKEKAQLLVVRAPDVLSDILLDNTANARHRIDSARALNDFTGGPGQSAPASDRFVITINLGSDVLTFDKSIAIDANDTPPITAGEEKKTEDDD